MPGSNITRVEAIERSSHLEVLGYEVTIDTTVGDEVFGVSSIARFTCNEPGYSTFIDAVAKKIISATLNGNAVDLSSYDGHSIFLHDLAEENELVVEMEGIYSKSGEGLQRSVDPVDGQVYLYTQAAPAFAQLIFPCFDQPNLKAPFTLTVISSDNWEVLSNSPLQDRIALADAKAKWEFSPTPRISSYIYALIAGPYHHVHDEYVGKKRVPLGIYVRKSLAAHLDAENIFKATKDGFAFYENVFDLAYPFEKYDQIAVVDYNWGAMENPGAVTFKEDRFVFRSKVTERLYAWRTSTILHEMAHMWFGDMVTMEWWDDIWLNESFAEFISYLALAESTPFTNSWVSFNIDIKNWGYRQDQLSTTHSVATDAPDVETASTNFDGISYAKGASILKQLFAYVGRDNFIAAIQAYFAKHAWGNTSLNDLLVELEAASGQSLTEWAATWLQTSGVNTLRPALVISNGVYSSVKVLQEAPSIPANSQELRPHRLGIGLYDLENGSLQLRKRVEQVISGSSTEILGLAGEKVADLLLINDGDLAFAKIRFDEDSISTLKNHLAGIEDPLAKVLCWSAAWSMVRDAELSASDWIKMTLDALLVERDMDVIFIIVSQLAMAIENYAHPSHRQQLRTQVADAMEKALDQSPAGSDLQLQFAKSFASFADSSTQQDRIRSILQGSLVGLELDANLRWALVNALVEQGLATRQDVDAELEQDKTLDGQLNHAECLAAFPSSEAKGAAWAQLLGDDLSISFRAANLRGFQRAAHRELLTEYVDKFFDCLLTYWNEKSYEVANQFVTAAFPKFCNTQETLDKANAWLSANKEAPAGLLRFVTEGKDALVRDLSAQAKDA
ncbi:MAG: aminopeptidase N [Actinomycetes bacterium]